MTEVNKPIVNASGGEVSPLTYGRIDIPLYGKAMKKLENWIALPQGGYKFRPGTFFVHGTRTNSVAYLYPFQFSDTQAYVIEATDSYFRFYTNNGIVLAGTSLVLQSTSSASGVTTITSNAHGLNTGGEVQFAGYVGGGWDTLNGNFYPVTVVNANQFSIPVDTSSFGIPTTTGTLTAVYEIQTPYLLADLPYLQFAQIADTAYIANNNYEPRKLIRKGNSNWTLGTYTRTTDPFPNGQKSISAITNANPGVITTSAAHGYVAGQQVIFSGIVGMTQLNNVQFVIGTVPSTTTFTLLTLAGVAVDTTLYGAYTSGGAIQPSVWPRAVQFSDSGRLLFGGTPLEPMSIWASCAPTTDATRYDNFTAGPLATDALAFTFAPVHGRIDTIEWISNTSQFLSVGCYGSIRTLYGAAQDQPITPSAITSKSIATFGAANTQPISNGQNLFYVQRGGILLRSVQYDYVSNNYITTDRNLVSEHLTVNGFKQSVETQGQPDLVWVTRYDGKFLSLTYKDAENISAWARHYIGGKSLNTRGIVVPFGKVNSISQMLRNQANSLFTAGDQLWLSVERQINGQTFRSIEYMSDYPIFPQRQDFDGLNVPASNMTSDVTAAFNLDEQCWRNSMFEFQKTACHMDMTFIYDGSQLGLATNANLTPTANTGSGITINSSASVFLPTHIGRQIWKQFDINGNGGGRATITAYNSPTQVTADVISNFDNTNVIPAGNWYLTAQTLTGLSVLNGESPSVVSDGSYDGELPVVNGAIAMSKAVSFAYVGYKYKGTAIYLNIDPGNAQTGSAQGKARNLADVLLELVNTIGIAVGVTANKTQTVNFRDVDDSLDRPAVLYTGNYLRQLINGWSGSKEKYQKNFAVIQNSPYPATILSVDLTIEASND